MKIAFELPYYAHGARGASQYGENLVRAMGALAPQDTFHAFTYFNQDYERHFARVAHLAAANVLIDIPRWPQRLVNVLESRLHYPFIERRYLDPGSFDIFHTGGSHPISRHKTVIMVHGISWGLGGIDPFFEAHLLPQVLRADRVLSPSKCALEFLLEHYPVDAKKCELVYYGVNHGVFRPVKEESVLGQARKKYSLPGRFLLCVGPFQFRDNIELVLYTLRRNLDHHLLRDVKLVLVGGLEEYGALLQRRVRELGLEDRVVFTGYVPHADLVLLYNLAEFYLHPSVFEELGAQLLEASSSGCAVLASRAGGIEESVRESALFFNPHQSEEFEKILFRALESPSLRAELKERSLESSRRFSWDEAARRTLEIYRDAIAA